MAMAASQVTGKPDIDLQCGGDAPPQLHTVLFKHFFKSHLHPLVVTAISTVFSEFCIKSRY
jgi:hypothetical protein